MGWSNRFHFCFLLQQSLDALESRPRFLPPDAHYGGASQSGDNACPYISVKLVRHDAFAEEGPRLSRVGSQRIVVFSACLVRKGGG